MVLFRNNIDHFCFRFGFCSSNDSVIFLFSVLFSEPVPTITCNYYIYWSKYSASSDDTHAPAHTLGPCYTSVLRLRYLGLQSVVCGSTSGLRWPLAGQFCLNIITFGGLADYIDLTAHHSAGWKELVTQDHGLDAQLKPGRGDREQGVSDSLAQGTE